MAYITQVYGQIDSPTQWISKLTNEIPCTGGPGVNCRHRHSKKLETSSVGLPDDQFCFRLLLCTRLHNFSVKKSRCDSVAFGRMKITNQALQLCAEHITICKTSTCSMFQESRVSRTVVDVYASHKLVCSKESNLPWTAMLNTNLKL